MPEKQETPSPISVLLFYQYDHEKYPHGHPFIQAFLFACDGMRVLGGRPVVVETLTDVCKGDCVPWDVALLDRFRAKVDDHKIRLAFAILVPDDRPASSAGNLFFEVGYWMGRRDPKSLCVVRCGEVVPPSNLGGTIIENVNTADEAALLLLRILARTA